MTRRITQWTKVNPGDYDRWCKDFDGAPFVRRLMAKFAPLEAKEIRTVLFAVHLGPHQLTREQVKRIWLQLDTRINVIDYLIIFLARRLKQKTRSINEDIAALLMAAGVPCRTPEGWSAEAIKKRREKARIHPWLSIVWPRFVLSHRFVDLLRARLPE
jgi:hypothetical protein